VRCRTAVFFGSAMNNSAQLMLDSFLKSSLPPMSRDAEQRRSNLRTQFSGFIFQIQTNLDPRHIADRIAFIAHRVRQVRRRDMMVQHAHRQEGATGESHKTLRPRTRNC